MFITTYWWVWLAFFILSGIYLTYSAMKQMNLLERSARANDLGGVFGALLGGLSLLRVVAIAVCASSGTVLGMGVVSYFTH